MAGSRQAGLIEFGATHGEHLFKLDLRFGQRTAANARVEERLAEAADEVIAAGGILQARFAGLFGGTIAQLARVFAARNGD